MRHSAVQRAIEVGRLSGCVVRDEKGRPSITNAADADREWQARTDPGRVSLTVQLAKVAGNADERAPLVQRLLEVAADLQADSRRVLAEYLPDALAGAAEALQEQSRPVTQAEIADALQIEYAAEGSHASMLVGTLLDAVDSIDTPQDELYLLARREGREAARGYPRLFAGVRVIEEDADGDE